MLQIRAGVIIKDAYTSVVDKVREEKPELEQYLVKTLGFAIGIEFRESSYVVGPKCNRPVKKDMVFSLSIGFADIPDPKDSKKTYSLLLLDTVKAGQNGSAYLSDGVKSKNDVIFYFEQEAAKANGKQTNGKQKKSPTKATRSNAVMKSKLRNENRENNEERTAKRRDHQRELLERRNEAGVEKYADPDSKDTTDTKKRWKRFESYQRENMLPENTRDLKVSCESV